MKSIHPYNLSCACASLTPVNRYDTIHRMFWGEVKVMYCMVYCTGMYYSHKAKCSCWCRWWVRRGQTCRRWLGGLMHGKDPPFPCIFRLRDSRKSTAAGLGHGYSSKPCLYHRDTEFWQLYECSLVHAQLSQFPIPRYWRVLQTKLLSSTVQHSIYWNGSYHGGKETISGQHSQKKHPAQTATSAK